MFHSDRRGCGSSSLNDIVLENKQISKNIKIIEMDYNNFNIKVWNRDGECKDLKGEKLKKILFLNSIKSLKKILVMRILFY